MKELPVNTRVVIVSGTFKGRKGTITDYHKDNGAYTIQLEGESPQVSWYRNEIEMVPFTS